MLAVQMTRWLRWAGWAAVVGGLAAIAMTPAFATAYFRAYGGESQLPFWFDAVNPVLDPLLTFAAPDRVYEIYGRLYNLVYLLLLPLVVALHDRHRDSPSRLEQCGYLLLTGGLVATTVGVAGDYWANEIGFTLELLGLLAMTVGVTTWGVAMVRGRVVPARWAWLMVGCGPGAVATLLLAGHVPSGPTLSFAIVWFLVGCLVVSVDTTAATSVTG